MPNKSFRTRDGLWQVLIVRLKKLTIPGQPNGSQSVVVRGLSGQLIMFQWFRTWYAVKMMLLAVIKALVKYKNILNTATYLLLSSTFVVADRPLTSINQTHVSILAAVCFTR